VASTASASTSKQSRMTDRATRVIALAHREAYGRGVDSVETEDLLVALAREGHGVAARALRAIGVPALNPTEQVDSDRVIPLAEPAGQALALAAAEAGEDRIDTEHLLVGLLQADAGIAARIYAAGSTDFPRLLAEIRQQAKTKPGTLPDLTAIDNALHSAEVDLDQATRHGSPEEFIRLTAERDRLVDARHEQITAWIADLDAYAALEIVRKIRALQSEIGQLRTQLGPANADQYFTHEDKP
jgi:ATP-dependent Clp protease ATP-binding subunit ClpA